MGRAILDRNPAWRDTSLAVAAVLSPPPLPACPLAGIRGRGVVRAPGTAALACVATLHGWIGRVSVAATERCDTGFAGGSRISLIVSV